MKFSKILILCLIFSFVDVCLAFSGESPEDEELDNEIIETSEKIEAEATVDKMKCCTNKETVASVFGSGRFLEVNCPLMECCDKDHVVSVQNTIVYQFHCEPARKIGRRCIPKGEYAVNTAIDPTSVVLGVKVGPEDAAYCCPESKFEIKIGGEREDFKWYKHISIQCV